MIQAAGLQQEISLCRTAPSGWLRRFQILKHAHRNFIGQAADESRLLPRTSKCFPLGARLLGWWTADRNAVGNHVAVVRARRSAGAAQELEGNA